MHNKPHTNQFTLGRYALFVLGNYYEITKGPISSGI